MTKYFASIRHHSISRARQIEVDGTLTQAKSAASREFGQEQLDYEIVIYEDMGDRAPYLIATRRVSDRKWQDRA